MKKGEKIRSAMERYFSEYNNAVGRDDLVARLVLLSDGLGVRDFMPVAAALFPEKENDPDR